MGFLVQKLGQRNLGCVIRTLSGETCLLLSPWHGWLSSWEPAVRQGWGLGLKAAQLGPAVLAACWGLAEGVIEISCPETAQGSENALADLNFDLGFAVMSKWCDECVKLTEGTGVRKETGCARSGKVCRVKRCFRGSEHARLTHELNCAIITGNYCTPARRRICIHTTLDHRAHLGSGTLCSQLRADRQRHEEPFPNTANILFVSPSSFQIWHGAMMCRSEETGS